MKAIQRLFCLLAIAAPLLLVSCSNDEEPIVPQDISAVEDNGFYYLYASGNHFCDYLKKKNGKWVETELEFPSSGESGMLNSPGTPVVCPIAFPHYLWINNSDVYTEYYSTFRTAITSGEVYDKWLDYVSAHKDEEASGLLDGYIWLSVANHVQIDRQNAMQLSFPYFSERTSEGYRFVLESVYKRQITIRIEYPQTYYGCDAVRLTYALEQTPKYHMGFDSPEEADAYVLETLAGWEEE